jgi:mannosyltransferase
MDAVSSLEAPQAGIRLRWRVTPVGLTVGLMLLALALRLIDITARPLWLDEAYSAWFSAQSWHVLWTDVPTYEPHPPFYYSLLKLWREPFGGSPLALRSFSLLFGIAIVPVVLAASFELERQQPSGRPLLRAGIAGFLAACSPMLVLLGAEARPYPLLIFAYAIATLGLLRLVREFAEGSGKTTSWLMLIAGTELGLWAHGLGLLYAICLGAALLPAWLRTAMTRERLVRGLVAASAIALLYLPCLLMIVRRAGDWGTGWLSWSPSMLLQLLALYAVPVEVLTISSAVAALAMILLAKRAVQSASVRPGWTAERAIVLLWFGPPLLAALISQFAMPIFLPRTLAATLVPAYLAMGSALATVEKRGERFFLAAALTITLIPSAIQIAVRPAAEKWDETAAYLKRNVKPGDRLWLYPNDSALPLHEAGAAMAMHGVPGDYPANQIKGPIRAGSPAVVSVTAKQATIIASDPALRDIPVIWLVTRQIGIFDPKNDLANALGRARRPGAAQDWGYISVTPYYRR